MVFTLVLLRHGESDWNAENRFTGWTDVPLSVTGKQEAISAGQVLKEKGYVFDIAYTSVLKRAIHTCWSVLDELDQSYIPIINSWRLNERHYGALQGLNKSETAEKHGEEQVKLWRRAFSIRPPPLQMSDPRWPGHHKMFQGLPRDILPLTECLADTVQRVMPFWFDSIAPAILSGKRVFIAAHGNSLRGLVKHLDKLTEEAVIDLNIPTGVPLVYHLDDQLKCIKKFYLMDEKELKAKMDAVAAQGKAK